ncbi:MAG: hypothetical protein ACM3XM_12240 [Mycobacterium leprae]
MNYTSVCAPRSLLLDPDLTAPAKVVWLLARLPRRPGISPLGSKVSANSVGQLAERSGLSRDTVRDSLKQLANHGWQSRCAEESGDVSMPRDLLLEQHLGAQAKVLYGRLQFMPGHFNYADLGQCMGTCTNTIKHAVRELVQAGWLECEQEHQRAPLYFTLRNPVDERRQMEVAHAKQRIAVAPSIGEGLMREYLSLLVDSTEFQDGGTHGSVRNPRTGMPLQFDRYYPGYRTALEFDGPQHFGATAKFTPEESAEQQARDLMKQALCPTVGVHLVVVLPADLSLQGMRQKIGKLLPQRRLKENELLLDFLEWRSLRYRQSAEEW